MEFESRVDVIGVRETVPHTTCLDYVNSKVGRFRGVDVIEACPSVGRSAILASLKKMTEAGIIRKEGVGRATFYVRQDKDD